MVVLEEYSSGERICNRCSTQEQRNPAEDTGP